MATEACTYVIFGATGNLSRIKLMPAFYNLDVAGQLPEGTNILAIGRREWTQEKWLSEVKEMIQTKIKDAFPETETSFPFLSFPRRTILDCICSSRTS